MLFSQAAHENRILTGFTSTQAVIEMTDDQTGVTFDQQPMQHGHRVSPAGNRHKRPGLNLRMNVATHGTDRGAILDRDVLPTKIKAGQVLQPAQPRKD
jgi:hypothetical protein